MRILMLSTGGTIAAVRKEDGLSISMTGDELIRLCPEISKFRHEFEIRSLFVKGSSNISPEDWIFMARSILEHHGNFDGLVISHGSDTLAYTASALSYLLLDFSKPVVVTGSMLPPGFPGTDAGRNLYSALSFASALASRKRAGVAVAFSGRLMHGPRSSKVNSWRKDAFDSMDYPDLGRMMGEEAVLSEKSPFLERSCARLCDGSLEKNIAFVSLFPGCSPSYFDLAMQNSPKAVVLEGFGLGGILLTFFDSVKRALDSGVPVFVRTQVPYGGVDLPPYELGRKMLSLGITPLNNMTKESMVPKLMLLGAHLEGASLKEAMLRNFCDDIFDFERIHSEGAWRFCGKD